MSDSQQPRATPRLVTWGLHTYWRFSRGLTLGVRAAILDDRDRVFLIRHTYVPGWQLPGGGVEVGETLEEALERELREEGNIVLKGKPRLVSVHFNRAASRRDHVAVFLVEAFEQTSAKQPDHEIAESGFFALDMLPPGMTGGTRRRIAKQARNV